MNNLKSGNSSVTGTIYPFYKSSSGIKSIKLYTDLELCLKYKETSSQVYFEELFRRYKTYLKKNAILWHSLLYKYDESLQLDDIFQDISIIFMKTVEYVDKSKITNPKTFKLSMLVKTTLSSYYKVVKRKCKVNKIKKACYEDKYAKVNVLEYFDSTYWDFAFFELDKNLTMRYEPYTVYDNKVLSLLINEFEKTLKGIERDIFYYFDGVKTASEIAKKYGMKNQAVYYHINRVKSKLKKFLKQKDYFMYN